MKNWFIPRTAAVCVVFLLQASAVFAGGYHFRYDSWANHAIRYLNLLHYQDNLFWNEMPYSRADMNTLLHKTFDSGGMQAFFRRRLAEEISFGLNQRSATGRGLELELANLFTFHQDIDEKKTARWRTDIRAYAEVESNLSLYLDFEIDTDGLYDSDYHSRKKWHEITGDMKAAYFLYSREHWSLLAGREYVHWGPGYTGSLLTSGLAPSLDMIQLTANIWKFRFQGFSAMLNQSRPEEDRDHVNRYLSGHRLSIRLPRVEMGIHETVVYGGPGAVWMAAYTNPLMPYYFTDFMFQENDSHANVSLAMDAGVYWPETMRWYGQFMVDEYYYDEDRGKYPDQTALLAGMDWARALAWDRLWINAEYIRVSRWVYNYTVPWYWNRLYYYNSLLGHPLGPDADWIHLQQELAVGRDVVIRLSQDFIRHGETTNDTPLNTQDLEVHPPFPYGIVEKTLGINAELEFFPSENIRFTGQVKYARTENTGHQPDDISEGFSFYVSLNYRYRHFFGIEP